MKGRARVLGAVLALFGLPLVVVLASFVSFQFRNRNNGSIVSSGEKREYLLYVPKSYDASTPTPLVLSMHGGAGWPVQQRDVSGWNRLADNHGFIVVYPSGVEALSFARVWRLNRGAGLAKDVRFISDLIGDLEKTHNIDPTRIYANGLSNGGGMAFVLSCNLSERIAAVGMVAAAQTLPWSWCPDAPPVPMIAFHGTADTVVPYEGGTSWIGPVLFPDVLEWAGSWARRNRCGPQPIETAVASDVTRREYSSCSGDASVVLYTVRGGGHTWPGGLPLPEWFLGTTTQGVAATAEMWAFFQEHRLPSGIRGFAAR